MFYLRVSTERTAGRLALVRWSAGSCGSLCPKAMSTTLVRHFADSWSMRSTSVG